MPTQKLSPELEREVALTYLCGVSTDIIKGKYDVSDATTRMSIVGRRSREWQDPLVEAYRETNPHNKDENAAHLILTFDSDIDPEPTGLVDITKDKPVYETIREVLYQPGIDAVVERTALPEYMERRNSYDMLFDVIFGSRESHLAVNGTVTKEVLLALKDAYLGQDKVALQKVFRTAGTTIIDKVRDGGLAWTDLKKGIVHDVLKTLNEKEQRVLGMRFGLDGYEKPKNLNEISKNFNFTSERIRQIEAVALRKLRHTSRSEELNAVRGFYTDANVKSRLDKVQRREERAQWRQELMPGIREEVLSVAPYDPGVQKKVKELEEKRELGLGEHADRSVDELELSIRTANYLQNADIKTIGELARITEAELLKSKVLGRKSLKDVREALADLGIELQK
jgi:hypothetical protein